MITHISAVHSILPKIQLGMFPSKIGGVTPVSLKTQSFLDRTYMCTFSTINTHQKITRQELIRDSANIAYIYRAHQIYSLYHKNEQIGNQLIPLTQYISHTHRKNTRSVFCSLLEKYYTCIFHALL
jgi:hypothetical protein